MSTIIISTKRGLTEKEKINEASLKYSNDESLRKAFRDGADWATEVGEFTFGEGCLGVFILILLVGNLIALFDGGMNAKYVSKCNAKSKWGYVFPGYRIGCEINSWMINEK